MVIGKFVAAVLVGGMVAACTANSVTHPSGEEAIHTYLAPMLCQKQSECAAEVFAIAYPNNGVSECVEKLTAAVTNKDASDACTVDELKTCRADYEGQACPTDPAANGLPDRPSSCSKC